MPSATQSFNEINLNNDVYIYSIFLKRLDLILFPKMFPCCCKEKFMMHVYGVICYMEVTRCHWKENELASHRTEMRRIRWVYGVKLRDKLFCVEFRQRLGIEDVIKVVQRNRLRRWWWLGESMLAYFRGWGSQTKGRSRKEVVDKDMDDLHIKLSDAMDRSSMEEND